MIFFSMATSFSAAALGAEGLAADVTMLVGNGYVPGHADYAMQLLREQRRRAGALRAPAGAWLMAAGSRRASSTSTRPTVRKARSLARKAGRPIVKMAQKHTTVTVERATLRLAGLAGADADGIPWANRLARRRPRRRRGLEHGVALPVWDALVRGEAEDLPTLAQKAGAGLGHLPAPRGPRRAARPGRGHAAGGRRAQADRRAAASASG